MCSVEMQYIDNFATAFNSLFRRVVVPDCHKPIAHLES